MQNTLEKWKLNFSCSVLLYMKTRVCIKYFVHDCRSKLVRTFQIIEANLPGYIVEIEPPPPLLFRFEETSLTLRQCYVENKSVKTKKNNFFRLFFFHGFYYKSICRAVQNNLISCLLIIPY